MDLFRDKAATDIREGACCPVAVSCALGQHLGVGQWYLPDISCKGAWKGKCRAQSWSFQIVIPGRRFKYGTVKNNNECSLWGVLCVFSLSYSIFLIWKQVAFRPAGKANVSIQNTDIIFSFFVIQLHSSVSITEAVIRHLLQFHKNRKLSTEHSQAKWEMKWEILPM